jgi:hypothetical protein
LFSYHNGLLFGRSLVIVAIGMEEKPTTREIVYGTDAEESFPATTYGPDAEPMPILSFWVVAFLDLLGYKKVLDKIDSFPIGPEVTLTQQKAFMGAVRLRRRLLSAAENLLEGLTTEDEVSQSYLTGLPQEAQDMTASWRKAKLIQSPGNDHIVLACSLLPEVDHFPIRGVYNLVFTVAGLSLVQLSLGAANPDDTLPLRGGIDAARGLLLQPENFLYSPAVSRAYVLECKDAVYARTVAGPRFIEFLDYAEKGEGLGPESEFERNLARTIRQMFFQDRDGMIVLDFLGDVARRNVPTDLAHDTVRDAWLFVRGAHSKAAAAGDYVVASKYAWLIDYMEPRLSAWGVDR